MPTPQQIIDRLRLTANEAEGGYFVSTYVSPLRVPNSVLPDFAEVEQQRPICSAIYYLLEPGGFSALHKVKGDMIYHFYAGDPVEMLLLYPDGFPNRYETTVFSNDISSGGLPMKVIPGGAWLGSRLSIGGSYALMGVTMAPGFDPADYVIGKREDLIAGYPEQEALIVELTRAP